jgi:taurine dioxygenase
MEIVPLSGALGAEIHGADIRRAEDLPEIQNAFARHSVIVIRGQDISPDEHLAFARTWGAINVNRFFQALDTHPEIAIVLKEPDQRRATGEDWHTDHAYDLEPAMGSILHAIEVPPYGGDTVYCSMGAAYDALSDRFKELLQGLYAWHSSSHVFGVAAQDSEAMKMGKYRNAESATQNALHPVVISHPLSGRKGLFVNPQFTTQIDGLAKPESDAILGMLYSHCSKPDFQCRVRWQKGDVTMWDNRATWHKAINDYQGHRRYMHRVTVEGCPLQAAH